MVFKGQVSSVDGVNRRARVTFRDMDSIVSAELPYAKHVAIEVGDYVVVALFSENMSDGLIVAAF
jgi:hypothetical protein